jgi:signal transduction histidine kinase
MHLNDMDIGDFTHCGWDTSSQFLIFSDNVFGSLVYYSHLFPLITLLFLSLTLLRQNWRDKTIQALALASLFFTAWSLSDLVLWATARPEMTMFFWSIILIFELLIYVSMLHFASLFIAHKPVSSLVRVFTLILLTPVLLLAHTSLNLVAYDYTNCYREAVEGPLVKYAYVIEALITTLIVAIAARAFFDKENSQRRREIVFGTIGILSFLLSFSFGNIIGTLEVDWILGQYGLLGVPVFAAFLSYLIIKYRSINVRFFAIDALVGGIAILILSVLFLHDIKTIRIVIEITFVLVAILGVFLVRSVHREIAQREQIQALANELAKANMRLRELDKLKTEFVSIASHQLRSPLTAIRGYASMLLDGDFGPIPERAHESLKRIDESSRFMALSIDDFLNVSRIESGSMKYEKTIFSLSKLASTMVDVLRPAAIKKGLVLVYRSDADGDMHVRADEGKVRQVIQNVIDNAMKYTPQGTITVVAQEDTKAKRARIIVVDTGVGMSEETAKNLFGKFMRAKNANTINVFGTGLGLYIARQMIEAMGGTLTGKSDGEGKGSTFTIELPLEA